MDSTAGILLIILFNYSVFNYNYLVVGAPSLNLNSVLAQALEDIIPYLS